MAGSQDQHLAQLLVKLLSDADLGSVEGAERLRRKMLKCAAASWGAWHSRRKLCSVQSGPVCRSPGRDWACLAAACAVQDCQALAVCACLRTAIQQRLLHAQHLLQWHAHARRTAAPASGQPAPKPSETLTCRTGRRLLDTSQLPRLSLDADGLLRDIVDAAGRQGADTERCAGSWE